MKQIFMLLLLALLAAMPGAALAQTDAVSVTQQAVETHFRDNLTFTLKAQSQAEIVQADLLYKIPGNVAVSRNRAEFTPGPTIEAQFVFDQSQPDNYLPAGAYMDYWWELADSAGNKLTTPPQTLHYLDERYDWRKLENNRLVLSWYEGDDAFGQALFDRANQALDTLQTDFGIELKDPVQIFIYANHDDFMDAYYLGAQEWAGGATFADFGVVMMGIAPSELDWGEEATTHEMSHVVLHRATDNPYTGQLTLPVWLDEGTAVYNSGEMKSRSDFKQSLTAAIKDNNLATLRTLSSPFPADPDAAIESYAQSGAVVNFIIDTYGPQDMAELLDIFAEGALYDDALKQSLGVDTDGLDNAYRQSINLPPLPAVTGAPAAATPQTKSTPQAKPTPVAAQPTAAPTQSAANPPAAQAQPVAEPKRGLVNFPCCLAGMAPLWVFGLLVGVKRFMA